MQEIFISIMFVSLENSTYFYIFNTFVNFTVIMSIHSCICVPSVIFNYTTELIKLHFRLFLSVYSE